MHSVASSVLANHDAVLHRPTGTIHSNWPPALPSIANARPPMPSSKSTYDLLSGALSPAVKEEHIEYGFIGKLKSLKYEFRDDIRDRATLEKDFSERPEALNRVKLTESRFARLLDEIVTPDVFTAAKTLRSVKAFTCGDGTPLTRVNTLTLKGEELSPKSCQKEVFLYHLWVLQVWDQARAAGEVKAHHSALLRQILENVASFLGARQFGLELQQTEIDDADEVATIVYTLSHKKVVYFESDELNADSLNTFEKIFIWLKEKYQFALHTSAPGAALPAAPKAVATA